LLVQAIFPQSSRAQETAVFSDREKRTLRSLWIGSLPPLPDDPSNAVDTDPRAAELGRRVFHDPRFSENGEVSCSTCHPRGVNFVDNFPLARGMGTTDRRTMPLTGVGYNTWFFWDGSKDSLWSQALGPFEEQVEHGITRTRCFHLLRAHYQSEYEELFGALPDLTEEQCPPHAGPHSHSHEAQEAWNAIPEAKREQINRIYANLGKSIAAFVRLIVPGESRFDRYAEAVLAEETDRAKDLYTKEEAEGLKLFMGQAGCTNCHFGPLFTNSDFHNLLIPPRQGLPPDPGRAEGIEKVQADEFNCLGPYSDARGRSECAELVYMDRDTSKYEGAFKTPSLRNVTERRFYMHAGQLEDLDQVLEHYQDVGEQVQELEHGRFTRSEVQALKAFLRTLRSPAIILEPFEETVPLPGG
ncbi:MAG: cytochrome-c peroxidase, partial [Desulfovibrionales bacterium]